MTDHHDEMRVSPDPSQAEDLRQRLHARMARVSRDVHGRSDLDLDPARLDPDENGDARAIEDEALVHLVDLDGPAVAGGVIRRRAHAGRWLGAAAALIVVGLAVAVIRDGGGDAREVTTTPGPPAQNGRIVDQLGNVWPEGTAAPTRPGVAGDRGWQAFDQATGSFLYWSIEVDRIWVVDEDGQEEANFPCVPSANCGIYEGYERYREVVFGPGPDEVTAPADDPDGQGPVDAQRVLVMGWDGTVRDTIDISAIYTYDANGHAEQFLADLAWSPDGSRLAVGTEPGAGCNPSSDPCGIEVWVFDRNGGEPELVHTTTSDHPGYLPILSDLAWSPDGHSLAMVAATSPRGDPTWPTLTALRFEPGEPVRADVLHVYDDVVPADQMLLDFDWPLVFAFAWSPDGTRIAVPTQGGLAEISADDGHVLARYPTNQGEGVSGLAWLPE